MRLVLDTSVLVAAFRSNSGASNRLLELGLERHFTMLATPALFLEYEAVLARPEQRKQTGMSLVDLELMLIDLAQLIVTVEVHFQWRPQLRDPADEMVLEAAMNGRADALVTHNLRDFASTDTSLGLRILSPGTVLKEILR